MNRKKALQIMAIEDIDQENQRCFLYMKQHSQWAFSGAVLRGRLFLSPGPDTNVPQVFAWTFNSLQTLT